MQGSSFETAGQQQGGRVLSWIQRMLTAPVLSTAPGQPGGVGPAKSLVAQTALLHLLSTNVDLFPICVDRCYGSQATVSRAYFQVPSRSSLCTYLCIHSLSVHAKEAYPASFRNACLFCSHVASFTETLLQQSLLCFKVGCMHLAGSCRSVCSTGCGGQAPYPPQPGPVQDC